MQWPSPPVARRPLARAALCLALLSLAPAAVRADSESADELDRWVPSLAVSGQILGQKASGSITSTEILGTPITTVDALGNGCFIEGTFRPPRPDRRTGTICDQDLAGPGRAQLQLVPDTSSSDVGIGMVFGASLEVMSPRLTEQFLSPRVFAHADANLVLAFERNLAGERNPGRFGLPATGGGQDPLEVVVTGQGSRAKTEVQPFLFSAGLGTAFTTTFFDRTVRIKPSFEYMWQQQKLIGQAHRAVKQEQDRPPPAEDPIVDFRFATVNGDRIEDQHGLGIGVEIEADSGRIGPIVFSPFLWGRGYHIVGDTEYELLVNNSDPNGVSAAGVPESVTYRYDFNPWVWRAGAGIRLRFVPR